MTGSPIHRSHGVARHRRRSRARLASCAAALCLAGIIASLTAGEPAHAERLVNSVAVFAALDKVTARISEIEVNIGETFKFGALKVTPRACYSRPPTEPPKTSAFVEVDEIKLNGQTQRLFTGWMFAQSPGLNAVEHPVYDVWLTNCKTASGDASAPRRP